MFIPFLAAATAAANLPKATPIDVASWFRPDDYPVEAQKKGIEGNARFEVDVDAEGKPTACRITQSSGSPLLDKTTCDVVLARAKFKPAMRHGKPVPGRYSKMTSWRLEGTALAPNGYFATVLDFSNDPDHPTCSVIRNGVSGGPTCEQALQKYASPGAGQKVTKLVSLTSFTSGDEQPYRGDPTWGQRVAFVAVDLYPPKARGKPACAVVAKEGAAPEADPCAPYADASTLSDEDKKSVKKAHMEQSLFAVLRRGTSQGRCKDGESAAEVRGCV